MRYLSSISLIMVSFVISLSAQDRVIVTGRIIDQEDKSPLPYAAIVYLGKSVGTVSNIKGEFRLVLNSYNDTDALEISYLGYERDTFLIVDIKEAQVISLKPDITELSDISIEETSKFKLDRFVSQSIQLYNRNKKQTPHIAQAYYSEEAYLDGDPIMFMESLGYAIFTGDHEKVAPLSNYKFYYDNTRSYTSTVDWKSMGLNSGKKNGVDPGGGTNLNLLRNIEYRGLLSNKHHKKYSYTLDSTYLLDRIPIHSIGFEGNGDKGSIHILVESQKIYCITGVTDKYWSQAFHRRLPTNVTIYFSYFADTPYLSQVIAYYDHEGIQYGNQFKVLSQKLVEFEMTKEEHWGLNNYDSNPYLLLNTEELDSYSTVGDRKYPGVLRSNTWMFDDMPKDSLTFKLVGSLRRNF